ncbi:MAG: hypothetical protein AAB250_19570 [Bdellovibrionota bacterium]
MRDAVGQRYVNPLRLIARVAAGDDDVRDRIATDRAGDEFATRENLRRAHLSDDFESTLKLELSTRTKLTELSALREVQVAFFGHHFFRPARELCGLRAGREAY